MINDNIIITFVVWSALLGAAIGVLVLSVAAHLLG